MKRSNEKQQSMSQRREEEEEIKLDLQLLSEQKTKFLNLKKMK
jgi:hypothetical protein